MNEVIFDASFDNIEKATEFVNAELEKADCPLKIIMQFDIAVDELFSNIVKYAYESGTGKAAVRVEADGAARWASVTFLDNGVPYDPLQNEDPDITLPMEERDIGGLGILMVKKFMDDIEYEYKDGQNILKIKKNF